MLISETNKTKNMSYLLHQIFIVLKKDQLVVFEKDPRPILCVNKIPKNMEIEMVKNIILNCGLHPENIH